MSVRNFAHRIVKYRIQELVEWGRGNVEKDSPQLLEKGIVDIRAGDGWAGLPEEAPFDAIHVGAAAATLPQALVDQLRVCKIRKMSVPS